MKVLGWSLVGFGALVLLGYLRVVDEIRHGETHAIVLTLTIGLLLGGAALLKRSRARR